ncbi:MAG TPA: DUF4163 domain-containing protein [Rhizomicrobium sp.]|jgi:hypothetical protein
MRHFMAFLTGGILLASSAIGADYDRTEKSPLVELRLRVPAAAMAIPPLQSKIMALYKADATQAKNDAKDDKEGNAHFTPYNVDTNWRVTFENDLVLSLSDEIYADTGGAHPNGGFQTIVWDKKAGRAVPIEALFAPGQSKPALAAIADAATRAWTKIYTHRIGQKPDADMAKDGISPEKLTSYALTYAKGQTTANGIVLPYGAGQVWPHVLGDFRLTVPAAVFVRYLAPAWKSVFTPAP